MKSTPHPPCSPELRTALARASILAALFASILAADAAETRVGPGELARAAEQLQPGQRLVLSPGVYRELVKVGGGGTPEAPAIIEAADPQNPPVLTGADAITGWKPLADSGLPEANHPHAAQIFYTDLDWRPLHLFVDARQQHVARMPNKGYWPVETADGQILASSGLSDVNAESLTGAEIFFVLSKTVRQEWSNLEDWDEKGRSVRLKAPLFKGASVPFTSGDRMYLANHLSVLDEPEEWVARQDGSTTRVYWWPKNPADLQSVEAPRRETVLDLTAASHVAVRGLEIRHAAKSSRGFGIGALGTIDGSGRRTGLSVERCTVYQNQRFGILFVGCVDIAVQNCLVVDNAIGVSAEQSRDITFEENQIAWNHGDGLLITWGSENAMVRRNVVHHHSRFGHPDNFQTYRSVKNVTLDSNVIVASGQGAHTQETTNLVARNNIFAGATANLFFTGKGDSDGGYTLEGNTFTLFSQGGIVLVGNGHVFRNNIIELRGGNWGYGGKVGPTSIRSTGNLFWMVPNGSARAALANFNEGRFQSYRTLKELQATGLEEKSAFADPGFPSVPAYVVRLDDKRLHECSAERLMIDPNGTAFAVGDHVEIDFDGIDRTVQEATADTIVVTPPLREPPVSSVIVANWGNKPVADIDVRTKSSEFGSTVDFEAFFRGDFDSDGKRDLPAWPDGIPAARQR